MGLASPATAQVINACVKPNGTLKVVAASGDCASNETPISWNVQGPQGEPGMDGMDGLDGNAGPSLRILDGAGTVLGILGHNGLRPFNVQLGLSIPVSTLRGRPNTNVFFDAPDCGAGAGRGYIPGAQSLGAIGPAAHLIGPYPAPSPTYFAVRTEIVASIAVRSELTGDQCQNFNSPTDRNNVYAADPFTGVLPFAIPVVEPIYIGLPID
jgi:hypothetical protein